MCSEREKDENWRTEDAVPVRLRVATFPMYRFSVLSRFRFPRLPVFLEDSMIYSTSTAVTTVPAQFPMTKIAYTLFYVHITHSIHTYQWVTRKQLYCGTNFPLFNSYTNKCRNYLYESALMNRNVSPEFMFTCTILSHKTSAIRKKNPPDTYI